MSDLRHADLAVYIISAFWSAGLFHVERVGEGTFDRSSCERWTICGGDWSGEGRTGVRFTVTDTS
ncbi:hypothetical protein HPP92_028749 [Vanilla planifolia]|uniref:Uncharacterized protein n=1 Tax=Vanilla planifolia TaxID=51239 RepID=A0A835P4C3_VANPL|nr:hypothetical protein HPP92_028749 [Vanilla planifolia]KAG0446660.1 hypothetical protein HPP92_028738 [Vanilla planifolia]